MTLLLSKLAPLPFGLSRPHLIEPLLTSPDFFLPTHFLFFLCSAVGFVVLLLPTEDPLMWFLPPRISFKYPTLSFWYLCLFNFYSLTKALWILDMLSNFRCICSQRNIIHNKTYFQNYPSSLPIQQTLTLVYTSNKLQLATNWLTHLPISHFIYPPCCHSSDLSKHKSPIHLHLESSHPSTLNKCQSPNMSSIPKHLCFRFHHFLGLPSSFLSLSKTNTKYLSVQIPPSL